MIQYWVVEQFLLGNSLVFVLFLFGCLIFLIEFIDFNMYIFKQELLDIYFSGHTLIEQFQ